jgi:hypothetical protein
MRFGIKFMRRSCLTALLRAPGDVVSDKPIAASSQFSSNRTTVSGIGGFCVINQFYNPQGPAKGTHKRRGVRAYEMPYEMPYEMHHDPVHGAPSVRMVISKTRGNFI